MFEVVVVLWSVGMFVDTGFAAVPAAVFGIVVVRSWSKKSMPVGSGFAAVLAAVLEVALPLVLAAASSENVHQQ